MLRSEKLSLLQVTSSLEARLGGPTKVVEQSFKYLSRSFENRLMVFGTCENLLTNLVFPTMCNNRYGFNIRLRKKIRDYVHSSDVLLIHGFYLYSTLLVLSLAKGKPVYIMPHGSLEPHSSQKGKFRKSLFIWIFEFMSQNRNVRFVCASEQERANLELIFIDYVIDVIGIGVEIPITKFNSSENLQSPPIRLACISRLDKIKRLDLCIRSLPILISHGYNVHLYIAGGNSGAIYEELVELSNFLGVKENVFFPGFLNYDQKQELLLNSQIFLTPSEGENFSVATAEAIVSQVPVLVGPNVGIREFVDTFKTGKVLVDLSEFDIAEGIKEILRDYDKMKQNCKASAFLLGWDVVSRKWIEVLSEL